METNGPIKPLLVGEANPYSRDPYFALYPEPHGATGDRLCRLIMGLPAAEYLRLFERTDLCGMTWSMKQAREAAAHWRASEHSTIVCLGAKVRDAFDLKGEPFTCIDGRFVLLPHPSGLCRAWSVPGAFARARSTLVKAGVLPSTSL